ncbi:hypothetical protein ACFL3G_11510 [Planctomycetota bacterium]
MKNKLSLPIFPERLSVKMLFFTIALLQFNLFGISEVFGKRHRSGALSWKAIEEKVREGSVLCSKVKNGNISEQQKFQGDMRLDSNISYVFGVGEPLPVKLPSWEITNYADETIFTTIYRWDQDLWKRVGRVSVDIESGQIKLNQGISSEGFFKLCTLVPVYDGNSYHIDAYAIISDNWKKDILAFCRQMRGKIELNPDPQLFRSCIVVSHLDNLMEIVVKSPTLSENIFSALSKAIRARADFETGDCPDLVLGLNKIRLKRFEGAQITEFVLFLPDTYDNSKKWPMLLNTDPRRSGAPANYFKDSIGALVGDTIVLWWHFPGALGYEWKDYKYFLDIISDKLNLDKDRIYVTGRCGNGIAAIDLGLRHPDQWAECSSSYGSTSRHLAGNALNLPLIYTQAGNYEEYLAASYYFTVECFKYYNCKFFRQSNLQTVAQARGRLVPTEKRNLSPHSVSYTIESLANPKAYWVLIDGREDENFIASIDATVRGQSILVKTDNVDAYTLNLELAPIDCNIPVDIIENGQHIDSVTGSVFTKKNAKYENALYVKDQFLHGPIADIFTDQYAVVWNGDENKQKLAKQLAGSGPCFADVDLPAEFLDTHNIVFVGRLDKSKYLKEITGNLPVVIEEGKLTASGGVYGGDFGVILIYPNPLNSKRYIAVFSGTTEKALNLLDSAWRQIEPDETADVGIFEVTENNQIKWLICEKFNTIWSWHNDWDKVLTLSNKKHPKWQWQQWVARTVRKRLKADVFIGEEMFKFPNSVPKGKITTRKLFNSFKNYWIIKIQLDGRNLRELLAVPFNDLSKEKIDLLIIDGLSSAKGGQECEAGILEISEIEDNKEYTVVLPHKTIEERKMGIILKDYKILDKGYTIILLNDYLRENKILDFDAELNSLKTGIF